MARIVVLHGIDDLASDTLGIAKRVRPEMRAVVREGIKVGESLAKDNAKRSAGPHGSRYYKRITSSMHGDVTFGGVTGISGEWGPHDGGLPVGAGYRHGPPNTDMAVSADVVGPAFYGEVRRRVDAWFW